MGERERGTAGRCGTVAVDVCAERRGLRPGWQRVGVDGDWYQAYGELLERGQRRAEHPLCGEAGLNRVVRGLVGTTA